MEKTSGEVSLDSIVKDVKMFIAHTHGLTNCRAIELGRWLKGNGWDQRIDAGMADKDHVARASIEKLGSGSGWNVIGSEQSCVNWETPISSIHTHRNAFTTRAISVTARNGGVLKGFISPL